MLQNVEWTATDLLADPLLHAVADAKWRVTTLRQRMAKLQARLDAAMAEEAKVVAAAEAFMATGEIPDKNFFPDLSAPTRKINKEYREQVAHAYKSAIQHGNLTSVQKIKAALEAAGIEDWRVRGFDTDGHVEKIILHRLSPEQGPSPYVQPTAIRGALRDAVKAYYAAWDDNRGAEPRDRAKQCARAALKLFYEFDGSELPDDLELHDEEIFDPRSFEQVVLFDHKDYIPPLRPRGTQITPLRIERGEETGQNIKRSWFRNKKRSGRDPPH